MFINNAPQKFLDRLEEKIVETQNITADIQDGGFVRSFTKLLWDKAEAIVYMHKTINYPVSDTINRLVYLIDDYHSMATLWNLPVPDEVKEALAEMLDWQEYKSLVTKRKWKGNA